jgi:hypothetical protein
MLATPIAPSRKNTPTTIRITFIAEPLPFAAAGAAGPWAAVPGTADPQREQNFPATGMPQLLQKLAIAGSS